MAFLGCSLFHHLPSFALGMSVFFIFEHFIQNKSIPSGFAIILVGASIFLYCAVAGVSEHSIYLVSLVEWFKWPYWQSILYGLVLMGLTIVPFRVLVNRITINYGKISYSAYLNHPTLVIMLLPIYRAIYSIDISPILQYGFCLVFTLVLLTIISYCTYRFIEQPGIRFGSHLIRKLQSRSTEYQT
jgi:peptidoglycan/LPS O-acetylase OafA/YrhL